MKKRFFSIMMLAAGAVMFIGCDNDDPTTDPTPEPDAVSIAPGEETFENDGGTVDVIVTSSGTWTLSGEYDWATPSAKTGKDGDVVKFTVAANATENDKEAIFTFNVGEAKDKLKLISKGDTGGGKSETKLLLISDDQESINNTKQQIEVKLDTDIAYRSLECKVEDGADWLTWIVTLKNDDVVSAYFEATANTTFENRTAEVTISGGGKHVKVKVAQAQTDRLEIDESIFFVELGGGTFDIQVLANVEFDVVIAEAARGWLSLTSTTNGKHTFTAKPIEGGETTRTATITFTSKDGKFVRTVKVTQKGAAIINLAANFTSNRAWPLWHNPAPVNGLETFTMEALVYSDSFSKTSPLSTIMGIEGNLLLRVGDVGVPTNQIQVIYPNGKDWRGNTVEGKLSNANMQLETGKWNHIAVTYDVPNKTIIAYVNGEEKGIVTNASNIAAIDFGVPHNDETGTSVTRCFWVGYAYEAARYWPGMMSELRIWNKVLTQAEINAGNHFYQVDPASEGLVAYWKCDDGLTGTEGVIKDYTANGNHLTAGSEIDWTVVSIP